MEHPAVAEAGVIGKPDPVGREVVKAFVSLKAGYEADEACAGRCWAMRARDWAPRVAPKEIDFLPMPAAHAQRQDHAPPAQGARTRAARRRHVHAGGRRMTDVVQQCPRDLMHGASARHAAHPPLRGAVCASCTAQTKIRGFLHLYIGEEAVAAGAMRALDA